MKSPLRTRACQPTAGLTSTFSQIEVNDHSASIGMTCQHVESSIVIGFLHQNYWYKFLATEIPHDAGVDQSSVREEISRNTGRNNSGGQQLGGRRRTSRTLASLESSSLPLPQRGSRYAKQRATATPKAGTSNPVARRKKTESNDDRIDDVGVQLLSPPSLPPCWRVTERPLLKFPHTDGGKTSRRFLKITPRSSSPEKDIIHNTGRESLNQLIWSCSSTWMIVGELNTRVRCPVQILKISWNIYVRQGIYHRHTDFA